MTQSSLTQRIQSLEKLTASEIKIADYFSRNYWDLAFENVTTLSRRTGVSKATVVRFLAKLGYSDFSEFRDELQRDTQGVHDTLPARYSLKKN